MALLLPSSPPPQAPSPPPPPPPPLPPPLPPQATKSDKPNVKRSISGQENQAPLSSPENQKEVLYLIEPLFRANYDQSDEGRTVVTFVHNINPVIQNGPMCGLVAVTMASELLQQQLAATGDYDRSIIPPVTLCHPDTLLEFAREKCLSKHGEMFSADYMLKVAKHGLRELSCEEDIVSSSSLDLRTIVCNLITGKAILVPYDADKDHTPCLAKGHKAHWCVLVGFAISLDDRFASDLPVLLECCNPSPGSSRHYTVKEEQKDLFCERLVSCTATYNPDSLLHCINVFARQGKSRHMGLWDLSRLLLSNGSLVEVDPLRADPEEYIIPEGGIEGGLCSRVLVLSLQKGK